MTMISKKYDFCHKKLRLHSSAPEFRFFFLNAMVIHARREVYLFPSTANRGVAAFRLDERTVRTRFY